MTAVQTVVREFEADLVVSHAETVAADVVVLTLARPDGTSLPGWTPGAHIDLVLPDGLVRQYSLCGRTDEPDRWQVAVLRAPDSRGGSTTVHALESGSIVRVRGPRNHFPVVRASRYTFIAGGIGITPLLPMIREVDAAGADWQLHYGGRERASMAFAGDLTERYPGRVHLEEGRLDLDRILGEPRLDTLVYACGPEPMLAAVEERCPPNVLHLERFSAKQAVTGTDSSFDVLLQRSGRTLRVPSGQSIFQVVRDAGVSVLGSCLEGICGTCETEVLDGDIDHRDSVLDDAERAAGDCMMICVSRARSPQLTLDL